MKKVTLFSISYLVNTFLNNKDNLNRPMTCKLSIGNAHALMHIMFSIDVQK